MNISLNTKLLTPKEVADFLQISTHQVNRLCRKGVLSRVQLGPRTYRIFEEELLEFVRQEAVAGALEHPHGRKEAEWHLPSKLHVHGPNDRSVETLPPFAWDAEEE